MVHNMNNRRLSWAVLVFIPFLSLPLMGLKSPVGFESDPAPPTDGQLEGAIKRRLDMDVRVPAEKVGVKVQNGDATLFGTVDTIRERKVAGLIAGSIRGVNAVKNELEYTPSLSKDEQITLRVQQVLKPFEFQEGNRLTVSVEEGVVIIGGTVLDHQDARQAELAVGTIPGVTKVENLLKVVAKSRSDEAIKKDIMSYLTYSPIIQADEVNVKVQDGVVSLEGNIDHLVYRDALQIDIENITGVKKVETGKLIPERLAASTSQEGSEEKTQTQQRMHK
jgi:hyperosmotically inducible protein